MKFSIVTHPDFFNVLDERLKGSWDVATSDDFWGNFKTLRTAAKEAFQAAFLGTPKYDIEPQYNAYVQYVAGDDSDAEAAEEDEWRPILRISRGR